MRFKAVVLLWFSLSFLLKSVYVMYVQITNTLTAEEIRCVFDDI